MLLVLGTNNRKKAQELIDLLTPWGVECQTLADYPHIAQVEETGSTFAENSQLKACQQARRLARWVLGEDSGLAVDALAGAPGVYSARFSGPETTDESNNRLLVEKLGSLPLEKRSAYYVSHVVLADPQGNVRGESTGTCRGRIRFEPAGSGGFGYDPYFEIIEYHRTFAELGGVVKSVISHRARAVRALIPQMLQCIDDGHWAV